MGMPTGIPMRLLTLAGLIASVFLPVPSLTAQGPYAKAPPVMPQVTLSVGRTAGSPWRLHVDVDANRLSISHDFYPGLGMEIDGDGPEKDGGYEGITLSLDGLRYEGKLYGNRVGFLSPDHDAGRTERVSAQALDEHLRVRFEGGSYRRLSPAGPDEPVHFEAAFHIDKSHHLNVTLNGLYYIFPSAVGTRVMMQTRDGEQTRLYSETTTKGYEYFEQVLRVEVQDPRFGEFRMEGLIERMQLHAHGSTNADVIEIDLDHTYKDRGQKEVLLRLLLVKPLSPADARESGAPAGAPNPRGGR